MVQEVCHFDSYVLVKVSPDLVVVKVRRNCRWVAKRWQIVRSLAFREVEEVVVGHLSLRFVKTFVSGIDCFARRQA